MSNLTYQITSCAVSQINDTVWAREGRMLFLVGFQTTYSSLQIVVCVFVVSEVSTTMRYLSCPFWYVASGVLGHKRLSMIVSDTSFPFL